MRRSRTRREELEEEILARVREAAPAPVGDGEFEAGLRAAVAAAADIALSGIEALAQINGSRERRLAEQVNDLLDGDREHGDPGLAAGLIAFEHDTGYDLAGEHLGVIATGTGAEELLRELAQGLGRRLLSVPRDDDTVWAWLGGRHPLGSNDFADALAASSAPADVQMAIGEPAHSLEGWRLTHRQAQAAWLVAERRPRQLTRYADVALLASVLKEDALGRSLIDICLAPLEDAGGGGPLLRRTLHAYFAAERNASSAASALGISRKTIASRLGAIEQRLGYPLRRSPVELEIALRLDDLDATTTVDNSSRERDFTQLVK